MAFTEEEDDEEEEDMRGKRAKKRGWCLRKEKNVTVILQETLQDGEGYRWIFGESEFVLLFERRLAMATDGPLLTLAARDGRSFVCCPLAPF